MKAKNGKVAWSPEEDEIIRRLYSTHTTKEIANQLHRPAGSVGTRADKLGLTKPNKALEENRIGTIIRPRPGVLIHYARTNK